MSTQALTNLRDYLTGTLSTADMIWLVEEMKNFIRAPKEKLKPYTIEELHERIARSEHDSSEGKVYDVEDVLRELEEEFAYEDQLEMTEAI